MVPTNVEILPPIPADTANAAQLVIRNSNFYLSVGRLANNLFAPINLGAQAHELKVSVQTLARLYLVTIFQFTEALTDPQATEAAQKRIDWKYALHLPLNYNGPLDLKHCDFRKWLLRNETGQNCLQTILARLSEISQVGRKIRLISPKADIIPRVCLNNRVAIVWGMINETLQILASEQPAWLGNIYLPRWYQRYGKSRLASNAMPASQEQMEFAQAIGADGYYLLTAISACSFPDLHNLLEVSGLRLAWEKQFFQENEKVLWRTYDCTNCPIPEQS